MGAKQECSLNPRLLSDPLKAGKTDLRFQIDGKNYSFPTDTLFFLRHLAEWERGPPCWLIQCHQMTEVPLRFSVLGVLLFAKILPSV